jgi:hypothetical protein
MPDLLYTLRAAGGTANENMPQCAPQDIPGRLKLDKENRQMEPTARYKLLRRRRRRLQEGAPSVIHTSQELAAAADKAGHADAARDARVAGGWLGRLARGDFASTTWDLD